MTMNSIFLGYWQNFSISKILLMISPLVQRNAIKILSNKCLE